MDNLQNELDTTYPLLKIKLLAVNEVGHESGNSLMVTGRDLPMLQDRDANQDGHSDAWTAWDVEYRDLVIVDAANSKVSVFNLTEHNLAEASEYATLRDLLIDAAMAGQKPWMNPVDPHDVDGNGLVVPRDVLVIINSINLEGSRELPPPTGSTLPPLRYDVNGDGFIAPSDVLKVVNYINLQGNGEGASPAGIQAEGEGGDATLPASSLAPSNPTPGTLAFVLPSPLAAPSPREFLHDEVTFQLHSATSEELPWGSLIDENVGDLVDSLRFAPASSAPAATSHDAIFTEEAWLLEDAILEAGRCLTETF